MAPSLMPGDGIIGYRTTTISRGQLRVFELRPGFWVVKRVGDVIGDRFMALSDNPTVTAVDSSRFGPVPIEGSYRVILHVPRSRIGTGGLGSRARRV